jgi:hypothetical protein
MISPMSTELESAAREFFRAEVALERLRDKLASAIVQAAQDGERPTDIVQTVDDIARRAGRTVRRDGKTSKTGGYTREHVRRILRAAGVERADRDGSAEQQKARSRGEVESGPEAQ